MLRSNQLFNIAFCLVLGTMTGCGAMRDAKDSVVDKTEDLKDHTEDKTRQFAERTDQWLNDEPMQQRYDACMEERGQWVERVVVSGCQNGMMTLEFDGEVQEQPCDGGAGGEADHQCLHRNSDGLAYYNDGPSVPNGLQRLSGVIANRTDYMAYNRLFWPAGVNHDYCYHHGLMTYGYERKTCDQQYVRDLYAVCANPESEQYSWFDGNVCRKVALSHYSAVRKAGETPFDVQNSHVEYPDWHPLWQQYELGSDPTNEDALEDIDNPSRRVSWN